MPFITPVNDSNITFVVFNDDEKKSPEIVAREMGNGYTYRPEHSYIVNDGSLHQREGNPDGTCNQPMYVSGHVLVFTKP